MSRAAPLRMAGGPDLPNFGALISARLGSASPVSAGPGAAGVRIGALTGAGDLKGCWSIDRIARRLSEDVGSASIVARSSGAVSLRFMSGSAEEFAGFGCNVSESLGLLSFVTFGSLGIGMGELLIRF